MQFSKGKSEWNIHTIGEKIKVEDLQGMIKKLQNQLENRQAHSEENKVDQVATKDLLSSIFTTLPLKIKNKIPTNNQPTNLSEEPSNSTESKLELSNVYDLLSKFSKEIYASLPSMQVFMESLPQVYASKDNNNIKIIHKDKILLDLDVEKYLKKEN